MKTIRTSVLPFAVLVPLVLGGCAGPAVDAGGPSSTAGVEVEEKLLTVDVRIARSLVDPDDSMTDEEIEASAKEDGVKAVVDGDAVVYTMTRAEQQKMLDEFRENAEASADELVADDSNSVTGVDFDDSMTSFEVSVDAGRYGSLEALLALGFYIQGALYQQFDGVPQDDIDVTVDFVDDATGEVLDSGSYQEMRANLEE
ncbi:hypothetical protein [Agromyces archimandritae]|uniref:Antigen I/II N-terminal domain-containing protein n=1 Tax=Agromyces archimandritae TaxID=2781962 RepID=A0A975FNP4_9MICO|nr:hypothetical protein [Agromyces archimandritae]QTX04366.1 hypothetical protein G127AT_13995 [Agromyces archimandritae]